MFCYHSYSCLQIANSCVTAAVLIANILSDVVDLASELSNGRLVIFFLVSVILGELLLLRDNILDCVQI